MSSFYARPVPGSAALKTARFAADPLLTAVEQLEPGQLECRQIDREAVGRAVVRGGFVPVLKVFFDEVAATLTPIEQVLYLHLYRDAYGEDRNFCRVARRHLCRRTGLSLRRFNRALEGLVNKGYIRLLQRDRRGTLYRVRLPAEAHGQRPGPDVLLGRVRADPAPESTARAAPDSTGAPRAAAVPDPPGPAGARRPEAKGPGSAKREHKMMPIKEPLSVGLVVDRVLAALAPRQRRSAALDILQEVTGLVEEGAGLPALLALADRFAKLPRRRAEDFASFAQQQLGLDG